MVLDDNDRLVQFGRAALDPRAGLNLVKHDAIKPANGTPAEASPTDSWRDRITSVGTDWYTDPPPLRRWLLRDMRRTSADGFLPRAKACQLIAEGGAGKTMAEVQLAISLATGRPWFDTFLVEDEGRPLRSLLILGEEDAEEARRRVYNASSRIAKAPPPGAIVIMGLSSLPCALLDRDDGGRSVETAFAHDLGMYMVETGPWDFVAVDPLSRFGGPDCEIDNAVATRFVQVIESFAEKTTATVLVAHHTNKPSRGGAPVTGSASRGATALHDGFRWQASLAEQRTEGGDLVTFSVTKSNYSRKGEPLMLRRTEDGGRLVPLTEAECAAAVAAVTGEAAHKERVAQREEEREATRAQREQREAAKRADRERAKDEAAAARRMIEERALVAVLRERPGISTDALRGALASRVGGCNRDRMRDILARLDAAVVTYSPATGPANARAYRLEESLLPEALR